MRSIDGKTEGEFTFLREKKKKDEYLLDGKRVRKQKCGKTSKKERERGLCWISESSYFFCSFQRKGSLELGINQRESERKRE